MTASPLWICLKIQGGKERKAHELFVRHFISSLPPLTQPVRYNLHGRRRTGERVLLPSYAFVCHDGAPGLEARLLRLQFPSDDRSMKAIRGREPGVIDDIVRRQWQPITRPVVQRVVGWVRHDTIMDLIDAADAAAIEPRPALLKAGDKARILLAGDMREVMITVVKGKRVRVMLDGREISTQVDKLEAA